MRLRLIVHICAAVILIGFGWTGWGYSMNKRCTTRPDANARDAIMESATPLFHTTLGASLRVPENIDLDSVMAWAISPDGSRIALISLNQIWVWTLDSNQVYSICPLNDIDGMQCGFVTQAFWVDSEHLLTFESLFSTSESSRYSERVGEGGRSTAGPLPDSYDRCVIVSTNSGNRILSCEYGPRAARGPAGRIVGARDLGAWYVVDAQGDLRLYDAFENTLSAYSFMHLTVERRNIAQIRGCSEWFSIFSSNPLNDTRGRLELVNVATAEQKSLDHVIINANPPVVTSDVGLLFTTQIEQDGCYWPVAFETSSGLLIRMPSGERWIPHLLSPSRGSLIVTLLTENPPVSGNWEARLVEIALTDLLNF